MTPPRSLRSRMVLVLLVPALIAGCIQSEAPRPDVQPDPPVLFETSSTGQPQAWPTGRWLTYDVRAASGLMGKVTAVFTGERFEADHRSWALEEATHDVPILGAIDAATGGTTAFGHAWDLVDLPLADGKQWAATVPILDPYGQAIAHEVAFTAKAGTVFLPTRQEPGFILEGRVGDSVVVEASHSPSLHLPTYIRLRPPGANETTWETLLREDGLDWAGPVWSAKAEPLVAEHSLVAPNAADPTSPYADPLLTAEFPGPSPDRTVFGYLVTVAFGGASRVALTDPEGKATEATAVGTPIKVDVRVVDLPGQEGTWQVVGVGAGAVAFSAAYLWAVELEERTLAPAG